MQHGAWVSLVLVKIRLGKDLDSGQGTGDAWMHCCMVNVKCHIVTIYSLYSVKVHSMYTVHCIMYSQCNVNVHCTLYTVQ